MTKIFFQRWLWNVIFWGSLIPIPIWGVSFWAISKKSLAIWGW